ncbi:uncharacterized protein [Arachis hypogaea]|uniref:uncharacterized protein n=1 Tax=Arachis hypogaea TaxID=3818 RepID=UPI003B217119
MPTTTFDQNDHKPKTTNLDDPVVISIQAGDLLVRKVLLDPGSSADVLFYSTFQKMKLSIKTIQPSSGELVGLSGERVSILGSVWLQTTIGDHPLCRTKDILFLVVDFPSPYNIILGRPSLNSFCAIVSTVHLCVKFQADDDKTATVYSDQIQARRCYIESLKIKTAGNTEGMKQQETLQVSNISEIADLDTHKNQQDQPSPTDDLEKVILDSNNDHITYVSHSLPADIKEQITKILQENADLFAWTPADMPGIEPDFICHKLQIDPKVRPIAQKKRNMGNEKRSACLQETPKLLDAGFIKELRFTTWLSNVVMVRKVSGYNQILMHPKDQDKTAFITEMGNYCYKVMPFGLKNAGATYQRLMDKVFNKQIGRNLEVYVDDMVIKTKQPKDHGEDIKEIFTQLRKHNMRLNPEKMHIRGKKRKIRRLYVDIQRNRGQPRKM